MTDGAYDADLPCKNASCRSFGNPHPNCRCYGDMSVGGEVKNFCLENRKHQSDCQYFADGGAPAGVSQPEPPPEPPPFVPDESPSGGVSQPEHPPEIPPFVPDVDGEEPPRFISDEEQNQNNVGATALASVEGGMQGVFGGAAPWLLKHAAVIPDAEDLLSYENQKERREAHPIAFGAGEATGLVGSAMAPVGQIGVLGKGADYLTKALNLSKKGSSFLRGCLVNGAIEGSDQVSKALLGQGDPNDAFAPFTAMGTACVLGGAFGVLGDVASGGLRKLNDSRFDEEARKTLAGYGHAAEGGTLDEPIAKDGGASFKEGFDAFNKHMETFGKGAAATLGYTVGHSISGPTGGSMLAGGSAKYLGPYITKAAKKAGSYGIPTALKWLSSEAGGSLSSILDYAGNVGGGESLIGRATEGLINSAIDDVADEIKPPDIETVKEWLKGGGSSQNIQQQIYRNIQPPPGFAEGGEVTDKRNDKKGNVGIQHNDSLAKNYPEQNLMLQVARGRISNYLSGLQPDKNSQRLLFDDAPDDTQTKKTYDNALKIAVSPLSVMDHIKHGTIEPEHIKHLNSLYPELTTHLQKKITERLTKAQVDEEKPSFKVRQGLSMFMGTPLSGDFTPQNIQAAQGVFMQKSQQQQAGQPPAPKSKKGTSTLTKADQAYLTGTQSREQRQQKG
jgi:hypothetical protein